jgi:hypothetical protein
LQYKTHSPTHNTNPNTKRKKAIYRRKKLEWQYNCGLAGTALKLCIFFFMVLFTNYTILSLSMTLKDSLFKQTKVEEFLLVSIRRSRRESASAVKKIFDVSLRTG